MSASCLVSRQRTRLNWLLAQKLNEKPKCVNTRADAHTHTHTQSNSYALSLPPVHHTDSHWYVTLMTTCGFLLNPTSSLLRLGDPKSSHCASFQTRSHCDWISLPPHIPHLPPQSPALVMKHGSQHVPCLPLLSLSCWLRHK